MRCTFRRRDALDGLSVVAVPIEVGLDGDLLQRGREAAGKCGRFHQAVVGRRDLSAPRPEMVCAENPNEYFHGRRAAVPTVNSSCGLLPL
jgi:hypothetical protein